MLKVGLTGNIGSGKTLVGDIFQLLGIPVFNADLVAKQLYQQADVKARLVEITSEDILDEAGLVDRKRLAGFIFKDEGLLKSVNALIHPLVREAFSRLTAEHSDKPYVIYEAAILVESGYYRQLDRLIVVHAPEAMRIQRVMERDRTSEAEVRQRIRNQADEKDLLAVADWVVRNDNSEMVIPQLLRIDEELRQLSAK